MNSHYPDTTKNNCWGVRELASSYIYIYIYNRKGVSEYSRSESIEMVWHVERMDEYRMTRRVLMAEVSRGRVRGRPRLGWMDDVKVALGNRGMMVEAA